MYKLDQVQTGPLKRFRVSFEAQTALFHQDDPGDCLFILIDGSVRLVHRTGGSERTVAQLAAGDIVGEKALCAPLPYRRAFTAIAETVVVALKLDAESLKVLSSKVPDFSLRLLQVVVARLDKANALLGILQIPDADERLRHYLAYLCRFAAQPAKAGVEITATAESLAAVVLLPVAVVRRVLDDLTQCGTLIAQPHGFSVPEPLALTLPTSPWLRQA